MKLKKLILLCALFLSAAASFAADKVTVNYRNAQLWTVLKDITRQSGYTFVYSDQSVKETNNVTIQAKKAGIKQVMDMLVSNSDFTYRIEGKKIYLTKKASAKRLSGNATSQQNGKVTVSGRVVDAAGEPVIGATIMEKGTNNGTITDFDGNYTLKTSEGSTLLISYVGYEKQELKVDGSKKMSVVMEEENNTLNETIVVGYGTQKKVSVTGSMASVKGSDITDVPVPNITNALAGRLPGLVSYNRSGEPGYDDAGLLIRGASTTGDSSPLLVVDGVADRAGSLGRLDPNDIESITILKDASAAIYGSRAANGVILVTTKRGSQEKLTFNYNGNFGLSTPTVLPEMCDSWQYAELLNEITPGSYSDEAIAKFKDGSDPENYPNVKAFDTLLKHAFTTQHNVSAQGGGKYVDFCITWL